MDELEFRRRIMSDPKRRDSKINTAIKQSEQNAQFADDILELDKQLAKAMTIEVPDDLADRILFNQTSANQDNIIKPSFVRKAMAAAASVAFVAGLLAGQLNWGHLLVTPAQASLASTAIAHVEHEKSFIEHLDEQVKAAQINAKMVPYAHQLSNGFPYHVYYLNHCGFGQSNALHMVFAGEKGKVALFLTRVSSAKKHNFNQDGMVGIVAPMGTSSMIIVANQGENVAKIAKNIAKIIKPSS